MYGLIVVKVLAVLGGSYIGILCHCHLTVSISSCTLLVQDTHPPVVPLRLFFCENVGSTSAHLNYHLSCLPPSVLLRGKEIPN